MRPSLLIVAVLFVTSCARPVFKKRWTKEQAPDIFLTHFETSKGSFEVEVHRDWSPAAADRFYQLVKHKTYDRSIFYRVVPNFVAQWGAADSVSPKKWYGVTIPDEPVKQSNQKGYMSFARAGKETRGLDIYINTKDNPKLDTITYNGVKGFPVFGKVINGMSSVDSLYSGYGERSMMKADSMFSDRAGYLRAFPKLDSIVKARIAKK